MTGSIFALDLGATEQFVTTWMGPSLGWALRRAANAWAIQL